MTDAGGASVHASAVRVGNRGVLIRGPSGSGKSRLAFDLITSGRSGQIAPAILVGDDRVHLDTDAGQLHVRPADELAGLIEIRGLGIRHLPFEPVAVVGLVIDLAVNETERLPGQADLRVVIAGITLRRIPVGVGIDPFGLVIAALRTPDSSPCGRFGRAVAAPHHSL